MKLLAIIVSYNFKYWIDRCLNSLLNSETPIDILVIDNCSKDDTLEAIKKNYPSVRLIANNSNLGFGQANNIGLKIAVREGYDAVLLLNQDAWINSDTLSKLVEASCKYPQYGILSPIHLVGDGSKPEHGFAKYVGITSLSDIPQEDVISVNFINAAIWFIPINVIKKVGMFAPLFYHYGEDKDYVNRIRHYGFRIGYIPRIYGCHDREFRETKRKDFFRAERVYHLSEYANINYSFSHAFAYGILAIFKKSYRSFAHGKISDFCTFQKMAFELLLKTRLVYSTRRESLNH